MKKITPYLAALLLASCTPKAALQPFGAVPTQAQLEWHDTEYYAFIHFGINTFTDDSWGYGDKSPLLFNPAKLDCEQWAREAKAAGMRGIILTAKHHDGFCLWPTATTEYSIKQSPYKGGKGDIVREFAEACRRHGLKVGFYLSPWDRNHAEYARDGYVKTFHAQIDELVSNYGDLFEFWFDGANGGDGYYGGSRETRSIDAATYYKWEEAYAKVYGKHKGSVIFSGVAPGVRWVGNEMGFAPETNWATFHHKAEEHASLGQGDKGAPNWVPAEVDVSIRPEWFYHAHENNKVKTPLKLAEIYRNSVGRNSCLNLNVPPSTDGLFHENDIAALQGLKAYIDQTYANDITAQAKVSTSAQIGRRYGASKVVDGDKNTFWMAPQGQHAGELTFTFPETKELNTLVLEEYLPLGQRIEAFALDVQQPDGNWKQVAEGTTVGHKRILVFPTVQASGYRVRITKSLAPPTLRRVQLCTEPAKVAFSVDNETVFSQPLQVALSADLKDVEILYTTDGSDPRTQGKVYTGPFTLENTAKVRTTTRKQGVQNPFVYEASYFFSKLNPEDIQASYKKPYNSHYPAAGLLALVDGKKGGDNFRDGKWQGIYAHDLDVTFDFKKEVSFDQVGMRFFHYENDHLFSPRNFKVYVSDNGKDFRLLGEVENTLYTTEKGSFNANGYLIKPMTLPIAGKTRYMRVQAESYGACPKGHKAEGRPSWIFADELQLSK